MGEFSGVNCGRPSPDPGEVSVNNDALELDLKINEGYPAYSAVHLPFGTIHQGLSGGDLAVPLFLNTLEQSGLSRWLRESESVFGFYFILTFHTIGLALVVGPNAAIDLRLLGVAQDIPLPSLRTWFNLMWLGLAINVTSGIFLVLAYPSKAVTNPDFYIKLTLVAFAVWTLQRIKSQVFDDSSLSEAARLARGKTLAVWSLALWLGVVTAGRLLAYTCSYLVYGVPC